MNLAIPVFNEVKSRCATAMGFSSSQLVTVSVKFIRYDWRQLVAYFQKGFTARGINAPWIILRQLPEQEANWDMASTCRTIPMEIFLLEDEGHFVNTTTSNVSPVTGTSFTVAATTYMFVGQQIWFGGTTNLFTTIVSITGLVIVVADSLTVAAATPVLSEVNTDVYTRMEIIREVFDRKTYTNFQIVTQPQVDVSDMNPVNSMHEADGYPIFAGSCFIEALVGSTP